MKEILLLGDLHANYPALKAIGDSLQLDRFDRIINTGDLTVYSTFPNETIDWFRDLEDKAIVILGNTDKRVLRILKGKKLKKPKKKEKRVMYFWTSDNLSTENIAYLKSLPKKSEFTLGRFPFSVTVAPFHRSMPGALSLLGNPKPAIPQLALTALGQLLKCFSI